MAGYRDDREALRQQKEALETEVADLRAALERERGGAQAEQQQAEREAEIGRRGSLGVPVAVALVVVGAAAMELGGAVAAALLVAVLVPLLLLAVLRNQVVVGAPYEALVVVGTQERLPDGSVRGWRGTRGRVVRLPLVQQVARIDLRPIALVLAPEGLLASAGVRVEVVVHAVVKVSGAPDVLAHAVERFLGQGREVVERAARQMLEGAIRETVAQLSPEQLALDRRKAAGELAKAAGEDLEKLGVELVGLWISEVRDSAGILAGRTAKRVEAVTGGGRRPS